jgi:hypothetical protein
MLEATLPGTESIVGAAYRRECATGWGVLAGDMSGTERHELAIRSADSGWSEALFEAGDMIVRLGY